MSASASRGSSKRSTSEYADVLDMFRELAELTEGTAPFQRQRDRIVERCLPLADHIARRFDGRGESRDDLVQVARVGLVTAVPFPWHTASLRVIERCGMRPCGQREHPFLGELLVFERRRS